MKQLGLKILENKKLTQRYYKLRLESPYLAKQSKPGQFLEVRCSDGTSPLLRRPLGTHRILKGGVEMLYEVLGRATELLSRRKAGGILDVIGPLGNGFTLNHPTIQPSNNTTILVAGGIGVAPLVALAERIKKKKIYALIGAKTKNEILCEKDFRKIGAEVIISTEDGSRGRCGFITDCLSSLLATINNHPTIQPSNHPTIYACGPNVMLKEVARIARERKVPCQVLLEEYMACGIGVCLGCPVKVKSGGYKMVCKDGPIFDAEEIVW